MDEEGLMELAERIAYSVQMMTLKPCVEHEIVCACRNIADGGSLDYHGRQIMDLLLESEGRLAERYAELVAEALYADKGKREAARHRKLLEGGSRKKGVKKERPFGKRPVGMKGFKKS